MTASEASADVAKLVQNPTATLARATTWKTFRDNELTGAQISSWAQVPDDRPIWVAVASGTVHWQYSLESLPTYDWEMVAYDQATGTTLASTAGDGAWPAWFTALPTSG